MPQQRPFLIRNIATGGEYEVASIEAFDHAYGGNPDWVIVTGPHRASEADLAAFVVEDDDDGESDLFIEEDDVVVDDDD